MAEHDRKTRITRRRYNRIAPFYDLMEKPAEGSRNKWRKLLWDRVKGDKILEIGVGTGKNFAFYPPQAEVMGANINRRTVESVSQSGLIVERVTDMGFGIFKLIGRENTLRSRRHL